MQQQIPLDLPATIQQGGWALALVSAVIVLWKALQESQKQVLEIASKTEPLLRSIEKLLEKKEERAE